MTRDEQNHEQMCGMAITKMLEAPSYLEYEPKTEIGKKAKKNVQWLYFNGGRYWEGYKHAVPKYSLAVLFSSFLMGEIAAATIFHQMAANCTEPVFKEAFRMIGRDEGRHMAICMTLMERDYPKMDLADKPLITKQIRAGFLFLSGVLFEPPEEFWDIPKDFIASQREIETIARNAGFFIPEYEAKKENWKNAMLNLKVCSTSTRFRSRRFRKSASPARKFATSIWKISSPSSKSAVGEVRAVMLRWASACVQSAHGVVARLA